MHVTDLSVFPFRCSSRRAGGGELHQARDAVAAVGWGGTVLAPVEFLGVVVHPVVEFTSALARLESGSHPMLCPSTLDMWECWPEDGQPAPLRIVGFVSVHKSWGSALTAASRPGGLGLGLIYADRRPSDIRLLDADASGIWVAGPNPDMEGFGVWVRGRTEVRASATRTMTTRLMEERLFAHALRSSGVRSSLTS